MIGGLVINWTTELGASGIEVSRIGTGTNRWAIGRNDDAVFETYRSLLDAGVNFFDTAEIYGDGGSERLLGECMRRDGRSAVVASKFMPSQDRLTIRQFMGALDATLMRLGVDALDLYYIHFPRPPSAIETFMDLMAEAFRVEKIRAVGVSNFDSEQMRRAASRLEKHGIPLAANEVEYSLMHRSPERDGVLDACQELNVSLIAYRPLARGSLASSEILSVSPTQSKSLNDALMATLDRIARSHGKSISQVALNWLLLRDEHVVPIPGATNVRHALENADTLKWAISNDEFDEIDAASLPV